MIVAVDYLNALQQVTEFWSPKVIGRLNDHFVKVAKLKGEIGWHEHAAEDEMFQVVRGRLRIQFEGTETALETGSFCVVPRGTMHNPVADEECWIVLIEPAETRHTGDVVTSLTRSIAEQLT